MSKTKKNKRFNSSKSRTATLSRSAQPTEDISVKKYKHFNQALDAYFSDKRLINWIKSMFRPGMTDSYIKGLFSELKKMILAPDGRNYDHTLTFIQYPGVPVIGINMETLTLWINPHWPRSMPDSRLIILNKVYPDWRYSIKDFMVDSEN